jgi:uncharacterized protein
LDEVAIYEIVKELLVQLNLSADDLGTEKLKLFLQQVDIKECAKSLDVGELTLQDIITALQKPDQDMREDAPKPMLRSDILSIENLTKEDGVNRHGVQCCGFWGFC